jgi:hypothetical protein
LGGWIEADLAAGNGGVIAPRGRFSRTAWRNRQSAVLSALRPLTSSTSRHIASITTSRGTARCCSTRKARRTRLIRDKGKVRSAGAIGKSRFAEEKQFDRPHDAYTKGLATSPKAQISFANL